MEMVSVASLITASVLASGITRTAGRSSAEICLAQILAVLRPSLPTHAGCDRTARGQCGIAVSPCRPVKTFPMIGSRKLPGLTSRTWEWIPTSINGAL